MKTLVVFVCLSTAARAADWHVSTSGNDANPGTQAQPFRTLAKGYASAAAGDTVVLRGGTYNERLILSKASITLRSFAGETARVSQPTSNAGVEETIYFLSTAAGGCLIGLEVTGGYEYAVKIDASGVVLQDCKFHDTGRDVVKIVPRADNVLIERCEVYNSGMRDPSNAEGIDNTGGSYMTVRDCHIHNIATNGSYAKGGARGVVYERNLVHDCGECGLGLGQTTSAAYMVNPPWECIDGVARNNIVYDCGEAGILVQAAQNSTVVHNTFWNVASTGKGVVFLAASAGQACSGVVLRNNILHNTGAQPAIFIAPGGLASGTLTSNTNCFWGSSTFAYQDLGAWGWSLAQWRSGTGQDAASIQSDPRLDAAYRLLAGSPCIDRGAAAGVGDDVDKQARPQGAGPDIGADEVTAAGDTTAPAVTITGPTSSATYATSSTPLALSGTASDNVGVTQVSWSNAAGGSGPATGTTSWSASVALAAGSNVITVTSRDVAGNTAVDALTVTYTPPDTTAPAVTITGPTSSATYATSSTPLALSGTASDNIGVTQVSWSKAAGGSGTATGTTSWSVSVALATGSNVITVTVRDAAGNTAVDTLTVTYTPPNTPPTCSVTSPAGGATFTAPASMTITATASDPGGSVSMVEFFNGATKLGEDLSMPYSFAWTSIAAGTYALTARATDNLGATGTSAVVVVTVNPPPNSPPACSITSPAGGATFTAPASITINATASDSDGSVSKVEFFNGATKLGEDLSTPYSFAWTFVATGTYSLTARATDNLGATGTSGAVSVVVNSPANTPPVCSITSPAAGATFTAPASVTIGVTASDPGGSVSKVEFFAGATKLGEDLAAPYSFGWTNVASGAYTLTARATDDLGATGTSAPVSIVVDPGDARDNDGDGIRNDLDPDDDNDGIADGADPDRDGDGASNGDESIAGTDPDDRTSFPAPTGGGGGGDDGSSCGATGLEALGMLLLLRRRALPGGGLSAGRIRGR